MDVGTLLGALVRGSLGRKRSRRAERFLTGGGGSFLNASTLLTAAGLGWGLYETMKARTTVPTGPSAGPVFVPGGAGPSAVLPPLPQTPLPDLPASISAPAPAEEISPELLRLVRLTISAARADGDLSDRERERILEHARRAGAEAVVQRELDSPRPLAEIVAGVSNPRVKLDMYILAFTIVHADEGVSGAERIYLAQLAHQLGLDAGATDRLEEEVAARLEQEDFF
jgi:uncharacterized membrane protein YebE (DUF533 family)